MKDLIIWVLIFIIGLTLGFCLGQNKKQPQEVPKWYIEKILDWVPPIEEVN